MATNFNLEDTIGYLVNRCAILLKNELTHRFRQAGYEVTPEEWVILNRLWEQDGLSQDDLAERTIKDKTTITRFLNQMEKKGLVTRKPSKLDARFKSVNLTSKGQHLKPTLIRITTAMLSEAGSNISSADIQSTLTTLKAIESNLLRIEKPK